jgi:NADPH:quinone reductase-like Zn-dependent oxidoreductase
MYGELADLIAAGDISAPVAGTYTFDQYPDALAAATKRQGKAILTP